MDLKRYKDGICGISCFCERVSPLPPSPKGEVLGKQNASSPLGGIRGGLPDPIYFDDEELDAYRGIAAGDYTEAQVEEFREVMTTMRPHEVPEWLQSLQMRGIALPEELVV